MLCSAVCSQEFGGGTVQPLIQALIVAYQSTMLNCLLIDHLFTVVGARTQQNMVPVLGCVRQGHTHGIVLDHVVLLIVDVQLDVKLSYVLLFVCLD